jgi:hypothetical protein
MEIRLNRTGEDRKALVKAVGEILDVKPIYKGTPSFAFDINGFLVDKNGTLTFDDKNSDVADNLLAELNNRGFNSEALFETLTIEVPKEGFSETAFTNLQRIVESKGCLIKKAIGTENLSVEQTEDTIQFPWFPADAFPEEVKAYNHFISALCEMAKTQHRVSMLARPVVNGKYSMRCFLLRLGFIGNEYKDERKILLAPLSGNSAFKRGIPNKEADSE